MVTVFAAQVDVAGAAVFLRVKWMGNATQRTTVRSGQTKGNGRPPRTRVPLLACVSVRPARRADAVGEQRKQRPALILRRDVAYSVDARVKASALTVYSTQATNLRS